MICASSGRWMEQLLPEVGNRHQVVDQWEGGMYQVPLVSNHCPNSAWKPGPSRTPRVRESRLRVAGCVGRSYWLSACCHGRLAIASGCFADRQRRRHASQKAEPRDRGSQCSPRPAGAKSERGESGPAGPKGDTTIRGEKKDSRHTCNMHPHPPPADRSDTNQDKYMQRRSLGEDTADKDRISSHKRKRLDRDVWRMGAPHGHGKGLSHLCRLWWNVFDISYW